MTSKTFFTNAQDESYQYYAFFCLAHQLKQNNQMFSFETPWYGQSPELGINIWLPSGSCQYLLESCIASLGYVPILDSESQRGVDFTSIEEKAAFKSEFVRLYELAKDNLFYLSNMHPADLHRAVCNPYVVDTLDLPSSHVVILNIDIDGDALFKTLWIEHLNQVSHFIWEDSKQFEDFNNWQNLHISFRTKRARNQYIQYLERLDDECDQFFTLYEGLFYAEPSMDPDHPLLILFMKRHLKILGYGNKQIPLKKPSGPFGYSVTNPINVRGIPESYYYLSRLTTADGNPVSWARIGSTLAPDHNNNPIDIYKLYQNDEKIAEIYICAYNVTASKEVPMGLKLTD